MKPLPILLAAAGFAAAASGYVWMESGASSGLSSPGSAAHGSVASDGLQPAGQDQGTEDAQAETVAEAARVGRSFRAGGGGGPSGGNLLASPDGSESGPVPHGVSMENLRVTRRHTTTDGVVLTWRSLSTEPPVWGTRENGQEPGKIAIGFGALAEPEAATGQESTSGVLSHPSLVPPAAPRLEGRAIPAGGNPAESGAPLSDALGAGVAPDLSNIPRQRGGNPSWPTGPFTPEQELYRAQIGADNFSRWLSDEAKKQRTDLR